MISTSPSPIPSMTLETRRIRVLFASHEVADSRDVLVLREPGAAPVWLFPLADVEMTVFERAGAAVSASKGPVAYFTLNRDAQVVEKAAWCFEAPPAPFARLAGRIAFHPTHFELAAEGQTAADWALEHGGDTSLL